MDASISCGGKCINRNHLGMSELAAQVFIGVIVSILLIGLWWDLRK
jgi:hypothetical protein